MKTGRIFLILLFVLMLMPTAYAEVSVFVDDTALAFEDSAPTIIDNRVFVPFRKIFEELGASVDWISESNTVYASRRFSVMTMTLGETVYWVDGEEKELDTPPVLSNNRVLIPVRAVSEALGADVVWDSGTNSVYITVKHGEHTISDCYIDGTETDDDGTVLMTYRAAYPSIQSDEKVCTAFNEFILGDAQDSCTRGVSECLSAAKAAYAEALANGCEFIPYMSEHSFDITYDEYNIISVVCADSNFSGGFHPSYNMYSMTYNLETGTMVGIGDIFKSGLHYIKEDVYNRFKSLIEENPDLYYDDATECLDEALSELKWYLAEDGVHFYLNPYEIAPYSAGVVEVVIKP